MTRRTLSWVIGGGVALVALFAALTTTPVVTGPSQSVAKTLSSDANESDTVTCAKVSFTATVTYSVTHPLLDLWGFRTIDNATIDPAALSVEATGLCGGPVTDLGGAAVVQTEACPVDISDPVATALATDSWGGACDNRLTYYSALNDGAGSTLTHAYAGPKVLAAAGFGRGQWCPSYYSEARYAVGTGAYVFTAQTTEGDFCLDVS